MSAATAFRRIKEVDPVVRADELGFVVFERKDAATMASFLSDFGFVPLEGAPGPALYFRGVGHSPFCVKIIPSDKDALVGVGFFAKSEEDLQRLAAESGRPVETHDAPGGGKRVRLTDPDGTEVDVVCGFTPAAPLGGRDELIPANTPKVKARINEGVRTPVAPTPVHRIGHIVLFTPDFDAYADWYMRWIGIIPSDVLTDSDGNPRGAFMRLNRGTEPADHHTIAIFAGEAPGVHHVSTEALDVDAIGQGQQYLKEQGWEHFWGIGRHILGSQIFDYWLDPTGLEWEHYADGDVMTEDYEAGYYLVSRKELWAWGDDLPDVTKPPPGEVENASDYLRSMLKEWDKPPRSWLP